MCGIAGQIALRRERTVDCQTVRKMTRALAHRGPDGEGEYVAPDERVALGHRRLSIIDLETGGQPIFNEDRSVAVVFNGEVYNFYSLRQELERAGHRFATRSDTEVIVHLYEDEGVACVRRLRGMFAFLLWDERRGRLLAARDRIGKKPLYYAEHGGRLSLASEITALQRIEGLPYVLNPAAIDLYLTYSYIPSPDTIWSGICKLPPAHTLVVEGGSLTIGRYWSPPDSVAEMSHAEASERLRDTLEEAVRIRLISDVPVGCFLSGGVDSSVICALMSRLGPRPVRTFSIGFDREEYNELTYAREVARFFGTEHEEFVVKPDAVETLPDLIEHCGEPFGDSSALPVWYLARLARQRVTVALTGDGGDEMFAGYPWYETGARLARASQWLPASMAAALRARPVSRMLRLLPRRVAKGLDLAARGDAGRFASLRRAVEESSRERLYSSAFLARLDGSALSYLANAYPLGSNDLLHAMATTDVLTYLPEDLLVKVDRMTMAHALEARSPLLDSEVVELALALPMRLKRDARGGKRIFKDAFGGLFPPGFLDRPKKGFSLPVDEWFRDALRLHLEARLFRGTFAEAGIVNLTAVKELLFEHHGGRSHGATLWNLLMLAEWFERFGGGALWP